MEEWLNLCPFNERLGSGHIVSIIIIIIFIIWGTNNFIFHFVSKAMGVEKST